MLVFALTVSETTGSNVLISIFSIQIITTPKKSGGVARHSNPSPVYSVSASGRRRVKPLNLDCSLTEEEGICDESPPAQIAEEQIEGLTQEISHLQVVLISSA